MLTGKILMELYNTKRNHYVWFKEISWDLIVPLAFVVVILFFFPSKEQFEFSTDEGLELMKARLVAKGYSLYTDVWNDQPPVLTYLLVANMKVFGSDVLGARYVVLFFSCVLIWAVSRILRMIWGNAHAIAGALLLLMLPQYLILSVSVMRGLPAIAFAMLSLYALLKWHDTRKYYWLIISPVLLGLSVFTKLFTGFLAPIFLLGLVLFEYTRLENKTQWYKAITPAVIWGAVFGFAVLFLGVFLIGPQNINQLVENHWLAEKTVASERHEYLTINWHLRNLIPFLFLAVVGTFAAFREKKWIVFYPFFWCILAYGVLLFHYPVWDHHQHLITIPAVILAANAVVLAAKKVYQFVRNDFPLDAKKIMQLAAIAGLCAMFFRLPESLGVLKLSPSLSETGLGLSLGKEKILYKMRNHAKNTHWVVTDLPMYAFRAGLFVPPNLAVISAKRIETGLITGVDILKTIQKYKPEQILLGRFKFPKLEIYLHKDYRVIVDTGNFRFYIRKPNGL